MTRSFARSNAARGTETYAWAVDDVAEFDYRLSRAAGLTDLDFHHDVAGVPLVRFRFTETSFLVYVPGENDMETVVRLSAYRDHQPRLRDDLRDRIRSALGGGTD